MNSVLKFPCRTKSWSWSGLLLKRTMVYLLLLDMDTVNSEIESSPSAGESQALATPCCWNKTMCACTSSAYGNHGLGLCWQVMWRPERSTSHGLLSCWFSVPVPDPRDLRVHVSRNVQGLNLGPPVYQASLLPLGYISSPLSVCLFIYLFI